MSAINKHHKTAMIMAGGTGGHIYPALAVARELQKNDYKIIWLGTQGGLEARIVPDAGIEIEWLDISGLRGKGKLALLTAPYKLMHAIWQARGFIKKHQPNVILGMGGFVAGPGGVAAKLAGVPLVIHEQNGIAGLTNRLLAKLSKHVLAAFPSAFGDKARVVGNPLRADIVALAQPTLKFENNEKLATKTLPRVLLLGGSLGAKALNETMPKALAAMSTQIELLHQCGDKHLDSTLADYQAAGLELDGQTRVQAYIDDMAQAMAWADVVLCRAGAMTVAELAASAKPAILVPYPYAVDDHQTANAKYLSDAGAAILIQQSELSAERLKEELEKMINDADTLKNMSDAARGQAFLNATADVAAVCKQVAL